MPSSATQAQLTAVDLLTFAMADDEPRRFLRSARRHRPLPAAHQGGPQPLTLTRTLAQTQTQTLTKPKPKPEP